MDKESTTAERHKQGIAQAVKLLARREHSRAELAAKLRSRGYTTPEIDPVLDTCETENWLNDERFAEIYSRQRMEGLYGPVRILAELQQRGIHTEPEVLAMVSESEWRNRAVLLRQKKFGLQQNPDWNERGRQGSFLARRGFTMSQIEHALAQRTGSELADGMFTEE